MEAKEIINLSVREVQNLRLSATNQADINLCNQAALAKLPSSKDVMDFVIELRYRNRNENNSRASIEKIEKIFKNRVAFIKKKEGESRVISNISSVEENWIKEILLRLSDGTSPVSREEALATHARTDYQESIGVRIDWKNL